MSKTVQQILVRGAVLGMLIGASQASGQTTELLAMVNEGNARAQVVVSEAATPTEQFAAEEFQLAVKQITGVELPIVNEVPETAEAGGVTIVLGTPATSEAVQEHADTFADDLAFLAGSDGFAVRRIGDTIYILGSDPKGVLNGVYSFLEENTSILWSRAGDVGTVYRPTATIVITNDDYRERPAFDIRGWHVVGIWRYTHAPTELWMARNRNNYKPTSRNNLTEVMPRLRKLGIQTEYGGGHNLNFWFPNDPHFETHPEYFALIDGVRRPIGRDSQLCFSHPAGTAAFIEAVLEKSRRVPEGIKAISVLAEDNSNVCECSLCTQPITLPDGSTLNPGDESFRSTQFYIWLNQVAKAVYAYDPNIRVTSYAYLFTVIPPKVDLFKNIDVRFCPFVKSDKHTLDTDINRKWLHRVQAWTQITPNVIWREYYGNASAYPRPLAPTVATDLRHVHSLGLRKVFAEIPPDSDSERGEGRPPHSYRWDASAMQFWIISRLYWNPEADVDDLRARYLDRVYWEAAPAMAAFYKLIRDSWYGSNAAEYYNAEVNTLAQRYIKEEGIEDACRAALEEAAALAKDEGVARRVDAVRERFEAWMSASAEHPTPTVDIAATDVDVANELDFETPAWQNASVIDCLDVMQQPGTPSQYQTTIRLLRDHNNLYVGILCEEPTGEINAPTPVGDHEQFPDGDRIELFIQGDQADEGLYYHLAFNAGGVRYDGKGYDKSWNGDWNVTTRIDGHTWRAVAVIPWDTVGVDPAHEDDIAALFYRLRDAPERDDREHSSWGGGPVHSAAGFGRLQRQPG